MIYPTLTFNRNCENGKQNIWSTVATASANCRVLYTPNLLAAWKLRVLAVCTFLLLVLKPAFQGNSYAKPLKISRNPKVSRNTIWDWMLLETFLVVHYVENVPVEHSRNIKQETKQKPRKRCRKQIQLKIE